jgi:molecular chaperone DnaK
MSIVLGIDLGTTNSAMAYVVGGKPVIINNSEGSRITPSVFFYDKRYSTAIVGEVAKRSMVLNPDDTILEAKRFIGLSPNDEEVKDEIALVGFKVVDDSGKIKFELSNGRRYSPEEIGAAILRKLKNDAEASLGQSITEAVITVPAYFNDAQRQATKDAGDVAGLKVLRIINEPTAAALAYGFEKAKEEKILVYDLGGGTFDVTVLEVSKETIEVLSTSGDTHLGGKDFDRALIEYIIREFKKDTGVDLMNDKGAKQRIKEAAEKCKHDLSTQNEHQINLPFITSVDNQPQHLLMTISRATFEELVKPLISKTMDPVTRALKDAGLEAGQINEVIMVGGMTRMPLVQKTVEEFFGKKPNLTVNPDEVVALGAAIQGAVLKGEVKDILLLDVTPLTLAIETAGGVATPMISRNTTIPTSKSQPFSTYADNQTAVDIHVVQGERPFAADNKSLGKFTLSGIAPAPRGVPQIEVTFDLDANGILSVVAVDTGTNKKANITITGSSTLSDEEKKVAIEEAERQREADLVRKAKVDAKNTAESTVFQAERLLKDIADKISEEDKKSITDSKNNLETLIKDENTTKEMFDEESKKLQQIMMAAGEKIYSTPQNSETQESSGNQNSESVEDVKKEDASDSDKKTDEKSSSDAFQDVNTNTTN